MHSEELLSGSLSLDLGGSLGLDGLLDLGLLLNAHEDDDRGADLAVDGDGDFMSTGNLDGLAELDALAVDVHIELGLDRVGDHGSSDGTEEDALLADLGVDGDLLAIELGLEGLGVGQTNGLALLDVVTALLELLEVTLGSSNGELLRNQLVLGVTLSDVDDVALAALALDLTKQHNFHGYPPYFFSRGPRVDTTGTAYGRRAISRARLMAFAMSC